MLGHCFCLRRLGNALCRNRTGLLFCVVTVVVYTAVAPPKRNIVDESVVMVRGVKATWALAENEVGDHLKKTAPGKDNIILDNAKDQQLPNTEVSPAHDTSSSLKHNFVSAKLESITSAAENIVPSVPHDDNPMGTHMGVDAVFQPVQGTVHPFLVYSAFYDARPAIQQKVVRVIGVTKTESPEKVRCILHYIDPPSSVNIRSSISIIRENWNDNFTAIFVQCSLPDEKVPKSVSVVAAAATSNNVSQPSNLLPVLNPEGSGARAVNNTEVAVCIKQLSFFNSIKMELVQFIELNKLLGVTHFIFYNHTVTEDVSCVLNYYVERGDATILQFNLHQYIEVASIHVKGQLAAQNDCLYRNMNKFHYLGFFDIDEFIVPHGGHSSIPEMIKALDAKHNTMVPASYSFKNAFFFHMFPDDEEVQEDELNLIVLRKTRHVVPLNDHIDRSKYITIPRRVKESGIHFVWEAAEGGTINALPEDGFLHHYRVCTGEICSKVKKSAVDRTIRSLRDRLVSVVRRVLDETNYHCNYE